MKSRNRTLSGSDFSFVNDTALLLTHVFFRPGHCDHIALRNGFRGQFLADAGFIRHFVSPVDRLVVIQAGRSAFRIQGALMMFMNDEVGNYRLNLQGRRLGNRTAANMDLDRAVIGMRHVADLFRFGQTAAQTKIRLDYLNRPVFQKFTIAETGINSFAGGDGNFDVLLHFQH